MQYLSLDLDMVLAWLISFLVIWKASTFAAQQTIEHVIKPVLDGLVASTVPFGLEARRVVILALVFGYSAGLAIAGDLNLFANEPFGVLQDAPQVLIWMLNAGFIAAGTFLDNRLWDLLMTVLLRSREVLRAWQDIELVIEQDK